MGKISPEKMQERDRGFQLAIEIVGSQRQIAIACGVSAQAVNGWTRIPPQHCLRVAEITGLPVNVLRPDIFGAPRRRPSAASRLAA